MIKLNKEYKYIPNHSMLTSNGGPGFLSNKGDKVYYGCLIVPFNYIKTKSWYVCYLYEKNKHPVEVYITESCIKSKIKNLPEV